MASRLPVWVILIPAPAEMAARLVERALERLGAEDWSTAVTLLPGSATYSAAVTADPELSEADHELALLLSTQVEEAVHTLHPDDAYEHATEAIDEFRDGRHVAIHPGDPYLFAAELGLALPRPDWMVPE